jgi:hypothetical protein
VATSLLVLGRVILRRPLPAQFPTKTTYWLNQSGIFTAIFLPFAAYQSYSEVTFTSRALEHARISHSTPFRWCVRTDFISPDDGMLLGGLAGGLISFRSVALRSLSSMAVTSHVSVPQAPACFSGAFLLKSGYSDAWVRL